MAQGGEWSRFNNQGQTLLMENSFSPGCTFFSVRGMAQGGEWSMLRNQYKYSSLLEKNSPDISSLMFYFMTADSLPDLIDVSGRMAQMIQFISLQCFLCRLISDDCYN
jgi:hypothetical protein